MDLALRLVLTVSIAALAAIASLLMKRYLSAPNLPDRFDRKDVDVVEEGTMLVEFTSPYCFECQTALPILQAAAETHRAPLAVIDAKLRPDLTRKYDIRSTPTILVVDEKGKVTSGWKTSPSEQDLVRALALAAR